MTYIGENLIVWHTSKNKVVWHTSKNAWLRDIHWRKLGGLTYFWVFWEVWHWGFTKLSSINFSLGILRDIDPPFIHWRELGDVSSHRYHKSRSLTLGPDPGQSQDPKDRSKRIIISSQELKLFSYNVLFQTNLKDPSQSPASKSRLYTQLYALARENISIFT